MKDGSVASRWSLTLRRGPFAPAAVAVAVLLVAVPAALGRDTAGTSAPAGARPAHSMASTGLGTSTLLALQQAEIKPGDIAPYDIFGAPVALSGSTMLVGAPQKSVDGVDEAGAVYVYVRSGLSWKLQQRLVADDKADDAKFGLAVAVSGDTALIGAPAMTAGGQEIAGTAYVYQRSRGVWTKAAELTEPTPGQSDYFGSAVALSSGTALIAAYGASVAAQQAAGVVYVYTGSGASWTERQQLSAPSPAAGAFFGHAVALSAGIALIGAPSYNAPGAAYVFTGSDASWTEQAELQAETPAVDDAFGWSLALTTDTAAVGGPAASRGSLTDAGCVDVFADDAGTWSRQAELQADDAASDDAFGTAVALSGSRLLVGAPCVSTLGPLQPPVVPTPRAAVAATSGTSGSVYVFDDGTSGWTSRRELVASDAAASDLYGEALAFSGTTAVIGASNKAAGTAAYAGRVYVESFAAPVVTLKASATRVKKGALLTLSGVVRNGVFSVLTVRVSRHAGGHATALKTVTLSSAGAYRWRFRPGKVGTWVLVTSYRVGGLTFSSKAVTVRVHG